MLFPFIKETSPTVPHISWQDELYCHHQMLSVAVLQHRVFQSIQPRLESFCSAPEHGAQRACMNQVMGGWNVSARAHVHTALLYLRNGLTDCVQIWYVGWGSLRTCFPQVMGGMGHLCTCARALPPHLHILGSD